MHTWRVFWFLSSLSKCELQLFHLLDQKPSGTTPLIVNNVKPVNLETSPSTKKPSLTFQSQYLSLLTLFIFGRSQPIAALSLPWPRTLAPYCFLHPFPHPIPAPSSDAAQAFCLFTCPPPTPWPPLSQGPSSKQMVRSVRILQGAFTYKGAYYKVRSACRRTSRDGVGTSVWT